MVVLVLFKDKSGLVFTASLRPTNPQAADSEVVYEYVERIDSMSLEQQQIEEMKQKLEESLIRLHSIVCYDSRHTPYTPHSQTCTLTHTHTHTLCSVCIYHQLTYPFLFSVCLPTSLLLHSPSLLPLSSLTFLLFVLTASRQRHDGMSVVCAAASQGICILFILICYSILDTESVCVCERVCACACASRCHCCL